MTRIVSLISLIILLNACEESSKLFEQLYEDESYIKIIERYKNNPEKYKGNPQVLGYVGKSYFSLKEFDKAIEFYEEAIDLDSNESMYHSDKGLAQLKLDDFNGAVLACERAIEINPDYVSAYINRSAAYIELKKWNWALDDLLQAQSMKPTNKERAYIHANLSTIYVNSSEYEKALRNANLAIELYKEISWAYRNRAFIYMIQNNADDAIEDINSGLELDSEDPYLWMYKGLLVIKVDKEIEKGCRLFEKAINEFRKREDEELQNQISIFEKYCN